MLGPPSYLDFIENVTIYCQFAYFAAGQSAREEGGWEQQCIDFKSSAVLEK